MVIGLTHRIRSKLAGWTGGGNSNEPTAADLVHQRESISREFDTEFYAIRYPDVTGDPLEHFVTFGWQEGRDPAAWFSTSFYLRAFAEVILTGSTTLVRVQHSA